MDRWHTISKSSARVIMAVFLCAGLLSGCEGVTGDEAVPPHDDFGLRMVVAMDLDVQDISMASAPDNGSGGCVNNWRFGYRRRPQSFAVLSPVRAAMPIFSTGNQSFSYLMPSSVSMPLMAQMTPASTKKLACLPMAVSKPRWAGPR